MNLRICLLTWLLIIAGFSYYVSTLEVININDNEIELLASSPESPNSLKMFHFIEKYSEEYDIPKYIAYNIAFKETRYQGPFHWKYVPYQTSSVGALGPMQVMLATSEYINKEKVSPERLKTDLEYNIRTSMKLLNRLYKKYNDWSLVCGAYNTGRPMINSYATFCATNKDYKSNWISIKPQNQK
jgi:soluble lytic murein transglycosylase-like protein